MQGYPNGEYQGWLEYILYEEMPKLLEMKNEADKTSYLNSVISQTYIKDILEHNDIRNSGELEELLYFGRINKS